MTKGIYLFKDIKLGEYEFYGVFVNDAVAIRAFKKACKDPNIFKDDIELYRSAAIDTRTGKIVVNDNNVGFGIEEPEFLMSGCDVNDEV